MATKKQPSKYTRDPATPQYTNINGQKYLKLRGVTSTANFTGLSSQQIQALQPAGLDTQKLSPGAEQYVLTSQQIQALQPPGLVPMETKKLAEEVPTDVLLPEQAISPVAIDMNAGITLFMKYKNTIAGVSDVNFPATIMVKKVGADKSVTFPFKTNKFIITAINKPQTEKYQVVETFGLPSLFFFDKRVSIYTLQGMLMDSFFGRADTDPATVGFDLLGNIDPNANNKYMWTQAFERFYEQELRATQLVSKNSVAILAINNYMLEGYPISLTIFKEGQQMNNAAKFDMAWIITNETRLADSHGIDVLYKPQEVKKAALAYEQQLYKLLQQLREIDAEFQDIPAKQLTAKAEKKLMEDLVSKQKKLREDYITLSKTYPEGIPPGNGIYTNPNANSAWN